MNGTKHSPNCQFAGPRQPERTTGFLLAVWLCAASAAGQDGYWLSTHGGSWAAAANWDPADGIAGGADSTAYFGFGPEAAIAPAASFSLDGPQTIGNLFFTTQGGAANWSFNSGAGGSITLENTFEPPEITITSPTLQVTLNAVVAGTGGVRKDGAGTLVLSAANTYTGQTLVSGGALDLTGSVASGVEVTNATLSGNGLISGPVVVDSGGTLSLGNPPGPLSINNTLVLLPGSTTLVAVGAAGSSYPLVQGLSQVTYGGTLVIGNLAGTLSLGQTFSIFGTVPAIGNFSSILPPPGPWQRWRFDPATGQITVVSSASQPTFAGVKLAGGKLAFELTGGPPGSSCFILATTNLSLPMAAWTRISTNVFDVSGNLTSENAVGPDGSSQIYLTGFFVPSP